MAHQNINAIRLLCSPSKWHQFSSAAREHGFCANHKLRWKWNRISECDVLTNGLQWTCSSRVICLRWNIFSHVIPSVWVFPICSKSAMQTWATLSPCHTVKMHFHALHCDCFTVLRTHCYCSFRALLNLHSFSSGFVYASFLASPIYHRFVYLHWKCIATSAKKL